MIDQNDKIISVTRPGIDSKPSSSNRLTVKQRIAALAVSTVVAVGLYQAPSAIDRAMGPDVPDLTVDAPGTETRTIVAGDNPWKIAEEYVAPGEDPRGVQQAITEQLNEGMQPGNVIVVPDMTYAEQEAGQQRSQDDDRPGTVGS